MILATESEMTPVKKGRNQKGEHNNHFGKPHSPEAKAAISATQKARYDLLRKAVSDDRIRQVVNEEIKKYLRANAAPLENKQINNIPLT
jgi:hypothetical protein